MHQQDFIAVEAMSCKLLTSKAGQSAPEGLPGKAVIEANYD